MSTDTHIAHEPHGKQAVARLERKVALLQDRVQLLEEENQQLAASLLEHGVNIHRKSSLHVELPPVITAPDPGNEEEFAMLSKAERRLLDELRGSDTTLYLRLSESLEDVGQWLFRSRLWIAATASDLIVFAAGRRPVVQRVPFRHIQESLYNNVTGELVLSPNRKFKITHIQLSPTEGYQFLAQIYAR